MGYELEKLKNLYGLSSPVSNYTGSSMPSAPTALTGTPSAADQNKYNAAVESYNTAMPKYLADQDAYQKYMQDRRQRLFNTNMYAPVQSRPMLSAPMYSNYDPNTPAPVAQNSIAAPSLTGRRGFAKGGIYSSSDPVMDDDTDSSAIDDGTASSSTIAYDPSAYDALIMPDVDSGAINSAYGTYRKQQQDISDLMSKYMDAQKTRKPDKSEMWWKLAAAFGSPTKTGSFGESLANAAGTMGEYKQAENTAQRADEANMLQLGLKQKEALANMSQGDYQKLLDQQAKVDANNKAVNLARLAAQAHANATKTVTPTELEKLQTSRQNLIDSGIGENDPRIKQIDGRINLLTTRAINAATTAADSYTDDSITLAAEEYLAGNKNAFSGMGRSPTVLAKAHNKVAELMKQRGASAQDIIVAQQTLTQQGKVLNGFASTAPNTQGAQVGAMNMLTGHIAILEQAAATLQRNDVAAFNRVKTFWENETNEPLPNNLNLIGKLVAGELSKAANGGIGTGDERKELKDVLVSGGANYDTIKEAADYASHLASQRVGVLKQQWTAVKLPEDKFDAYLTPATKAVLSRQSAPSLTPKQQAAIKFLKDHPNDPRAAGVRDTLLKQGVKL